MADRHIVGIEGGRDGDESNSGEAEAILIFEQAGSRPLGLDVDVEGRAGRGDH